MEFKDHGHSHALYDALHSLCEGMNLQSYMEIGVADGRSLTHVLQYGNPETLLLCDTWGITDGGTGRESPHHIEELLRINNYEGVVEFLNGDSHVLLPPLVNTHAGSFDVVLVDGDHSYYGALDDLRNAWPLVAPGGYLVFDDVGNQMHPGLVRCFTDFLIEIKTEPALFVHFDKRNGVGVIHK